MPRNRIYFARRAEQSQVAMAAAADPGARLAHKQLKRAYALLAESPAEPVLLAGAPIANAGGLSE